jgi:hypothetical protein
MVCEHQWKQRGTHTFIHPQFMALPPLHRAAAAGYSRGVACSEETGLPGRGRRVLGGGVRMTAAWAGARTVLPLPFLPTIRVSGLANSMTCFSFGLKDRIPWMDSFSMDVMAHFPEEAACARAFVAARRSGLLLKLLRAQPLFLPPPLRGGQRGTPARTPSAPHFRPLTHSQQAASHVVG